MKVSLKKSNILEIDKHLIDSFNSKIVETKLFALLKLVDSKGTAIHAPENESLHGLKVLEYKAGYYIGYIKTVFKNGSFKLKTFSLKNS
jgi:hypothetical protein